MRNVFISIILILGITACKNQDVVFPDYTLQAVYFPYQLPVRTLSLGEDRIDNTLDKEYKFDIGVCIGGMYQNKNNWTVDYIVDPTLLDSAFNLLGVPFIQLPNTYYSLDPVNTATIPSGSFNGLIRVQLTDQFFNDSLALTGQYVIPLRITGTSADSVLSGKAIIQGVGDRRVISDWESGQFPKDWVLFGIKYVNAYHGTYLHRGRDIVSNGGVPVDTVVFRNKYIEQDLLMHLTSIDKQSVATNGIGVLTSTLGKYSMVLSFENTQGTSGAITIKPRAGSDYAVTGTGQYFDMKTSTESWTGLVWQSMYLKYNYNDGINDHQVSDTLVFRDREIKFELNTIVIHH